MSRIRTPSPVQTRGPAPSTPSRSKTQNSRRQGYSFPDVPHRGRSPRRRSEVRLLICVHRALTHRYSSAEVRFNPHRINDCELWRDIGDTFRYDVQSPWERILSLKHVKTVLPVSYSPNGIPLKLDEQGTPDPKEFRFAYHNPDELRPERLWVDWFVHFDADDSRRVGLQFVEGLYADKLAFIGIVATIAIIVVSIVWCVRGGELQTVFTVMGFVLTLVSAQVALAALYYQVVYSG